jgi:ABC-type uncharacterized transport system permease subunit
MNQPSSTITAAFLAGMAMSLVWAIASEFFGIKGSESIVSLSVTFVGSAVGYFWPETVHPDRFAGKDFNKEG